MNSLFLALIALGMLIILVLIIFLVDRVRHLEKRAADPGTGAVPREGAAGAFQGLGSRKLWDALTGQSADEVDPAALEEMRARYQVVLDKHVQSLFQEGVQDARSGHVGTPKNTRRIQTLRGAVDAWLPPQQAQLVYECGARYAQGTQGEALQELGRSLDDVQRELYAQIRLVWQQPLSVRLIPELQGSSASDAPPQTGATPAPLGRSAP